MGLKPYEVNSLTFREFGLMDAGYSRKYEKSANLARNIMSVIINFGGWGSKTPVKAEDIWPLNIDKQDQKKYITTLQQAMDLLKEFKLWQG